MRTASARDGHSSKNVSIEAKHALIRRVVESSTFAKSERLSSFLVCVCDLTLSGRASEINEQKIGTTVFGRSPDYDSSVDGIVRPQASRLRHRLDLYFSGEGANEPVRITLPRGSYVPVFEPHSAQKSTDDPPPLPAGSSPALLPTVPSTMAPPDQKISCLAWFLVGVLLVALIVVSIRSVRPMATKPEQHPRSEERRVG